MYLYFNILRRLFMAKPLRVPKSGESREDFERRLRSRFGGVVADMAEIVDDAFLRTLAEEEYTLILSFGNYKKDGLSMEDFIRMKFGESMVDEVRSLYEFSRI